MLSKRARLGLSGVVPLLVLGLSGCATGSMFGSSPIDAAAVSTSSTPTPSASPLEFNSVFTDMGSVHPTQLIADRLQLELDMWTEQKTHEWYYDSDKKFSFVIDVTDQSQTEDAPFATKRLVYMSNLTVTATTTTTSGTIETPLVLSVDPIAATLDPEALSSSYGLLITSPKGGFQLESQTIGTLAPDTIGLNLDFAMTLTSESSAASGAFVTQTIHQTVPVAIFSND
jgi:hypothetical protein